MRIALSRQTALVMAAIAILTIAALFAIGVLHRRATGLVVVHCDFDLHECAARIMLRNHTDTPVKIEWRSPAKCRWANGERTNGSPGSYRIIAPSEQVEEEFLFDPPNAPSKPRRITIYFEDPPGTTNVTSVTCKPRLL